MRTSLVVGSALLVGSGCGGARVTDVTCEPGLVSGPTVVKWTTKKDGVATVRYGLREGKLDGESPGVPAARGQETVLGLETAANYFVQVVVTDDKGKEFPSDVVECTTDPPPITAPAYTVNVWNPDLACEDGGYILVNYMGDHESGVTIINRDGRYVWAVESDRDVQYARARLGRDGKSILWNTNDYDRCEDIAHVERLSLDGAEGTSTRTFQGHHDFVELPDGQIAWVGYNFKDHVEMLAAGFDLAALGFPFDATTGDPRGPCQEDEGGDWDDWRTAYDVVYEAPEGNTSDDPATLTLVWDQLRDWPEGTYWNNQARCNVFLPGFCELGHTNSFTYYEASDRYAIGLRWLDAIVVTDRTGANSFTFGGQAGTLTGAPQDLHVHAHFSDVWDGGMMVFDNHDPDFSRLMHYAIDEAAGTYQKLWTVQSDVNEAILGDMRRMPIEGCENILVSWSSQGRIEEFTPDGQTVWEASFALGDITGRVQYLSSLDDFADQAYSE